jgi:pimeloyl-ACP methyl ester carboxylesterase
MRPGLPWPLLALLGVVALFATGCFPFRSAIRDQAQGFLKAHPDGLHSIDAGGHPLRYAAAGPPGAPLILFIHGSPGSWEAFAGFLQDASLTARARLLAVDRPGYGGSEPGQPLPSLAAQAERLTWLLKAEAGGRKAIVLGHSLGGPIAAQLALDHPELVAGLVLVAPSLDPAQEKMKWMQVPASWGWLRPLIPAPLDVCNQEILPLKGQLQALLPRWASLTLPVRLIQGLDDDLVPPANADFAERVMTHAQLKVTRVPGLNHFVPWARPDLLRDALLDLLNAPVAQAR